MALQNKSLIFSFLSWALKLLFIWLLSSGIETLQFLSFLQRTGAFPTTSTSEREHVQYHTESKVNDGPDFGRHKNHGHAGACHCDLESTHCGENGKTAQLFLE